MCNDSKHECGLASLNIQDKNYLHIIASSLPMFTRSIMNQHSKSQHLVVVAVVVDVAVAVAMMTEKNYIFYFSKPPLEPLNQRVLE